jgi:transposase-like protein
MARTRRTFNAEFKSKVVLEIISGSKSMAEACREYSGLPPKKWTPGRASGYTKFGGMTMSDKVKKSYTREFKLEAIQLYETSGRTLADELYPKKWTVG